MAEQAERTSLREMWRYSRLVHQGAREYQRQRPWWSGGSLVGIPLAVLAALGIYWLATGNSPDWPGAILALVVAVIVGAWLYIWGLVVAPVRIHNQQEKAAAALTAQIAVLVAAKSEIRLSLERQLVKGISLSAESVSDATELAWIEAATTWWHDTRMLVLEKCGETEHARLRDVTNLHAMSYGTRSPRYNMERVNLDRIVINLRGVIDRLK